MFHQLLPFTFFPATAAAHNVSRFRVVLGAEFSPLYHSAVAEASNATASPPAAAPAGGGGGGVDCVSFEKKKSAICGHGPCLA